ncbi:MAG TPA: hypothetical protein VIW69_02805 [Candidatus Elarobacter sp.]
MTAKEHGRFPRAARGYGPKMERRDLYQDDLTEERQPTPGEREDVASTEVLDPDASADGEDQQKPKT